MAIEKGKGAAPAAAAKGKGAVAATAAAEKGKGPVAAAAAAKGKGGRPAAAADDGRTVKLKSSDEQIFEVPAKVATLFKAIADVVDKGDADETVPLPNVHSGTLAMVIEYGDNHLRMDAEPDVRRWDKEFVRKLDTSDLFDLILAANYLDYECLLNLMCKAVADMIEGKTTEQMREILGIENDFTPEEEAEMVAEYPWAFGD
uniref:Uncharacterized protein n=1 Tax=Avena sativa TaxID=4498 RepID=A0ACD5WQ04_AVESA